VALFTRSKNVAREARRREQVQKCSLASATLSNNGIGDAEPEDTRTV